PRGWWSATASLRPIWARRMKAGRGCRCTKEAKGAAARHPPFSRPALARQSRGVSSASAGSGGMICATTGGTAMKLKWSDVTPQADYLNRRAFLTAGMAALATPALGLEGRPSAFSTDEALNSLEDIAHYNNFYEFGTGKSDPSQHAGGLKTSPWS